MSEGYSSRSNTTTEDGRSLKQYLNLTMINSQTYIYKDGKTKAPLAKKNWIIRLRLENGKYRLKSTKTNSKTKAIARAQAYYEDLYLRQKHHLPLTDKTFEDILQYWLTHDGLSLTQRRRNAVERWFRNVFAHFLVQKTVEGSTKHTMPTGRRSGPQPKGLFAKVSKVKPAELKRYAHWRIDQDTIAFLENTNPYKKPIYARRMPSRNTLGLEIGNFNVVSRCAHRNNQIDREILIPTLAKTNIKLQGVVKGRVRPANNTFTNEQIDCIRRYMPTYIRPNSSWCRGICMLDEDGNGVRGDDGAIRSKNGMYVSRVNLYASFFIMLNTGMRLSELYGLKWKNIKRIDTKAPDKKGRDRHVYLLRVNETKPYRVRKAMVPTQRIVVGPKRLETIFARIKQENPNHCTPEDYVINIKGAKRRTQQTLFSDLLVAQQHKLVCHQHEDGTPLHLGHLRSYYVSKKLLDDEVSPILLQRQTGHSLQTILSFYITHRPETYQLLEFGGWSVDSSRINHHSELLGEL